MLGSRGPMIRLDVGFKVEKGAQDVCQNICCVETLTRIAPSLNRAYVNLDSQRFDKLWELRAYRCVLNTVSQHDSTTVSLLNTGVRKPPCQSIAVTVKLVVCQFDLLVP
jgi:hypothetical protein